MFEKVANCMLVYLEDNSFAVVALFRKWRGGGGGGGTLRADVV